MITLLCRFKGRLRSQNKLAEQITILFLLCFNEEFNEKRKNTKVHFVKKFKNCHK